MKVAILGYGKEGQAALEYWQLGNELTVCDQNPVDVPEGVGLQAGPDLLVRSPGLHPGDIVTANTPQILAKVTSVTNEFFKVCPTGNIIGITGTKGKGTTSSLVAELLKAAGKTVHLGGNIGIAPLEMLKNGIKPDDWVVLELSNFQLIDLKSSPQIATCLMVVSEHLDWHADIDEYVAAKQQLFSHQTAESLAIFNRNNALSQKVTSLSVAAKISYEVPELGAEPLLSVGAYLKNNTIYMDDTAVCQSSDVALLGRHNLENVCAAIATVWELINHDVALVQKVVRQFKGLPHRLELILELDGVKYYNDSFAATPEASMAALNTINAPKVMIVGGFDRNLELSNLAQTIASHQSDIRKLLIIGAAAKRLSKALDAAGFSNYKILQDTTMSEVTKHAQSLATAGDSVVLSPGFASFDMFKNFEDRGNRFKDAVKSL
jgi:UDP-N-acetylmuramoylalanine--D-glutamate ligase